MSDAIRFLFVSCSVGLSVLFWVVPFTESGSDAKSFPGPGAYSGFGPVEKQARLSDQEAGYARVVPGKHIRLPADYAAHPDFRLEWWYLTANLKDETGEPVGIQWTLFRNALAATDKRERSSSSLLLEDDPVSGWYSRQIWMGHAAVTSRRHHLAAEKFARGGIGQAGVSWSENDGMTAWIDDWQMRKSPEGSITLTAGTDDFSYALTLEPTGSEILQGDKGYSLKSADGQASYYFSHPYLSVKGTVRFDTVTRQVSGMAWLDREWSSQLLAKHQQGWDWFSLRLSGLGELTAFQIRNDKDDQHGIIKEKAVYARLMQAGTAIDLDDLVFTPLDGNGEGEKAPRRWRLSSASSGIDITVDALNHDSIMPFLFGYFEGPVTLSGSHEGEGYLEMTGYEEMQQKLDAENKPPFLP